MRFRKREPLLGVLLSTGLYLLDNLRERLPDNVDDINNRARQTYETAFDRLGRATNVLRGEEESRVFGEVGILLIGVGVGVGLLIAPAIDGPGTEPEPSDDRKMKTKRGGQRESSMAANEIDMLR